MWGSRRQPTKAEIAAKVELAERVLASPKIEPLVREEERAKVREREALAKRLVTARSAVSSEQLGKLMARVDASLEAVEAARKALRQAQADHVDATAAQANATSARETEVQRAEAALVASADPRISAFDEHLSDLWLNHARFLASAVAIQERNAIGGRTTRYENNLDEVNALQALLREARAAMHTLQLQALDRDAVTEQLTTWRGRVHAALHPLGIKVANVTLYDITLD